MIHQPMNRSPRTMRNTLTVIVSEKAILDHRRKISRSAPRSPRVFNLVAIGMTTAAMATTKSIRYTRKLLATT